MRAWLVVLVWACVVGCIGASPLVDRVWPAGNIGSPDLPQSSPFGPRLQASQGYIYDYHRGVDIPLDMCSPLYAIDDGVVRLSGDYEFYSDRVVQITHSDWAEGVTGDLINNAEGNSNFYATYLHLNLTYVSEDDVVTKGQLVACSGLTNSFPHLHFEIRAGGVNQRYNINPWQVLPYVDTPDGHDVSFNDSFVLGELDDDGKYVFAVVGSAMNDELDLNVIRIELKNSEDQVVASKEVDFNRVNYDNDGDVTNLDNPDWLADITIGPRRFRSTTEQALYDITFRFPSEDLGDVADFNVVITGIDVRGNEQTDEREWMRSSTESSASSSLQPSMW